MSTSVSKTDESIHYTGITTDLMERLAMQTTENGRTLATRGLALGNCNRFIRIGMLIRNWREFKRLRLGVRRWCAALGK